MNQAAPKAAFFISGPARGDRNNRARTGKTKGRTAQEESEEPWLRTKPPQWTQPRPPP